MTYAIILLCAFLSGVGIVALVDMARDNGRAIAPTEAPENGSEVPA